jgi:hypothetical protein
MKQDSVKAYWNLHLSLILLATEIVSVSCSFRQIFWTMMFSCQVSL